MTRVLAVMVALAVVAPSAGCATLFPPPPSMKPAPAVPVHDDSAPHWLPVLPNYPKHLPVAELRVNGEPTAALFDTGATSSALSFEMIEKIGLTRSTLTETVRGADGRPVALSLYKVTVSVGVRVKDLLVTAMPRTVGIDMLLGRDFLDDVELVLPAAGGQLGLFSPGRGPRSGLSEVHVDKKRDGLFAALVGRSAAGRTLVVDALIDTGANATRLRKFDIGTEKIDARGVRPVKGVTGGFMTLGVLELKDAKLSGTPIGTVVVNVDDTTDAPALLGMDVLSRFDLVVGTKAGTLLLGPPGGVPVS